MYESMSIKLAWLILCDTVIHLTGMDICLEWSIALLIALFWASKVEFIITTLPWKSESSHCNPKFKKKVR